MSEITDKERLDWLELQCVSVRAPMMYGSHGLFNAFPGRRVEEDEEDEPSDLRSLIDDQIRSSRD